MTSEPGNLWMWQDAVEVDSAVLPLWRQRPVPALSTVISERSKAKADAVSAKSGRFKWSVATDTHAEVDHGAAQGMPLTALDLPLVTADIERVQRSDAGVEGLFFVQLTGSRVLVVKRSWSAAAEVVSSMLCQRLGLVTPCVRLIRTAAPGVESFVSRLCTLDGSGRARTTLPTQRHLILMEYVRGCHLTQACQASDQVAQLLLAPDATRVSVECVVDPAVAKALHMQAEPEAGGTGSGNGDAPRGPCCNTTAMRFLHSLGQVMAMDMLVNNGDRLPTVWENGGNMANVMVAECGLCVPIDTAIVPIAQPDLLQRYEANVGSVLQGCARVAAAAAHGATPGDDPGVRAALASLPPSVRYLQQLILGATGVSWGDIGMCIVCKGVDSFRQTVAQGAQGASLQALLMGWAQRLLVTDAVDGVDAVDAVDGVPDALCDMVNFVTRMAAVFASVEDPQQEATQ